MHETYQKKYRITCNEANKSICLLHCCVIFVNDQVVCFSSGKVHVHVRVRLFVRIMQVVVALGFFLEL